MAAIPLVFIGGIGGNGDNGLMPVAYLKTHRQHELEADQVAVKAMAAAGFDPSALLNYMDRVQPPETEESQQSSTLPPRSVRLSNLRKTIQNSAASNSRSDNGSFRAMQDEVRRELERTALPYQVYRVPSLIHPSDR
jgi:predicted Zn-dependent protease